MTLTNERSDMARTIFLPSKRDIVAILDPLGNTGCDAHLVGMVLDAAIGAVIPELAGSSGAADHDWGNNNTIGAKTSAAQVEEPNLDAG